MLQMISFIISTILMTFSGFYVIKKLTDSKEKIFTIKNIVLLLILMVIPVITYDVQYSGMHTLAIYLLSIIIYKYIFREKLFNSIVLAGIYMLLVFFADLLVSFPFIIFFKVEEVRSSWLLQLISNVLVFVIVVSLINIKPLKLKLKSFINKVESNNKISISVFFVLLIAVFCSLFYNVTILFGWNSEFMINAIVMIGFFFIAFIFIQEQNSYSKLVNEYDELFDYVQDFETRIEEEQLNRHEYKNNLAIIMSLTKDKKVIDKIKELTKNKVNVESEWINGLKSLPKSAVKGLIFYKLSVAKKNEVNVTLDISDKITKQMKSIDNEKMKVLCKLVGIYFDNAIEASNETNDKNITFEIYDINKTINIVISNSINKKINLEKINKKGSSTKGKNRGNGLYYAKKIINKNKFWLKSNQIIIDEKYFVQKLEINN